SPSFGASWSGWSPCAIFPHVRPRGLNRAVLVRAGLGLLLLTLPASIAAARPRIQSPESRRPQNQVQTPQRPQSPAPKPDSPPTTVPAAPLKGQYHLVLRGENLFRIAQFYGVSVEALRRAN